MSVFLHNTLTDRQCRQITKLHDRCISAVPSSSSLLSLVLPEDNEIWEDTFYLTFEANGTLLSFLSVFCPDGDTVEISGFTDPAERHRGYFSRLLSAAKKEAQKRFQPLHVLYQGLSEDPDTASFCRQQNLSLAFKECMMSHPGTKSDNTSSSDSPVSPDNFMDEYRSVSSAASDSAKVQNASALSIRPAGDSDRELLIRLHLGSFLPGTPGFMTEEETAGYMDTILSDPATTSFLLVRGSEAVGLYHVTCGGESSYFMGLGILPAFRRQGLAAQALKQVLSQIPEDQNLLLQVSTRNTAAWKLYQKLEFQVVNQVEYFE